MINFGWSTCEVDGRRQVDEGEVVVEVELAPAGVGEEVRGDHLGRGIQRRL